MDPLSITTGCLSLVGTITKVSLTLSAFVRTVRDARNDLDSVSRELLSLRTVLELLAEDTKGTSNPVPQNLEKQISGIVGNCDAAVQDIEKSLQKHETKKMASINWAWSGREEMARLRSTLEAHKSALELALDMVALSVTRDIKMDTTEIKADTTALKQDTEQILADIARLQAQLPQVEQRVGSRGFMLQRYLDELTSYAETVVDGTIDSSDGFTDEKQGDESDVASNRDSETEASKELEDASRNLQSGGQHGFLQTLPFPHPQLDLNSNSPHHASVVEFNTEKPQYPHQSGRDLPKSEGAIPMPLPLREDGVDRSLLCRWELEDGVYVTRNLRDDYKESDESYEDPAPILPQKDTTTIAQRSLHSRPSRQVDSHALEINDRESYYGYAKHHPGSSGAVRGVIDFLRKRGKHRADAPRQPMYNPGQLIGSEEGDKPRTVPAPSRMYTSSQKGFETLALTGYRRGSADANTHQRQSGNVSPATAQENVVSPPKRLPCPKIPYPEYPNPDIYLYRVKAFDSYDASSDDANEISFLKGEIFNAARLSTPWWWIKKENGETGIAPSNFLTLL